MIETLDQIHIYLKKYRVISILIIFFFAWQCHELTEWYKANFATMTDWQNAPVIGLITAYVGALKFALDHILKDNDEDNNKPS